MGQVLGAFWRCSHRAGFAPNQFNVAHPEEFLAEKTISLMRKLNKFPTTREIGRERTFDPEFPNKNTFRRFGSQRELAQKIAEFCRDRAGYEDVLALCQPMLAQSDAAKSSSSARDADTVGEVYLAKSGRYYKIGRTNDRVRRGTELRIQLPEKVELIHAIVTDDPSGIEAYWHRRFDAKRMQGEWFDLAVADVKAFKRWRHVY